MSDKKIIVLSLGGSLIVPEKINYPFLEKFKQVLRKNYSKYKFVVVCGGGTIARKYISALQKEHKSHKEISQAGIMATRMNAKFMMQFFGKEESNDSLPLNMEEAKNALKKNNVVFCGALRWAPHSTSDTTAAKLANFLNTEFINLTNVSGLYSANPLTNKSAKFIPYQTWKDFDSRVSKIDFKAGQHFVLDQDASKIIKQHKIRTYIIGPNLTNLEKILKNQKFNGTLIAG